MDIGRTRLPDNAARLSEAVAWEEATHAHAPAAAAASAAAPAAGKSLAAGNSVAALSWDLPLSTNFSARCLETLISWQSSGVETLIFYSIYSSFRYSNLIFSQINKTFYGGPYAPDELAIIS